MVLLVMAAVVVVLLVVHRSEGNLGRTLVEYALVGVLAVLLAATPATAGMTAGVASGGDPRQPAGRGAGRVGVAVDVRPPRHRAAAGDH
jgi:hypothetical protein